MSYLYTIANAVILFLNSFASSRTIIFLAHFFSMFLCNILCLISDSTKKILDYSLSIAMK